jgi:hypothetical protein
VPSTMLKSLLNFNVAFVDISQTLYDSGLNSRRVILREILSSAIVCLLVCLFVCLIVRFEPLCLYMVSDDAGHGLFILRLIRSAVPRPMQEAM